MKTRDFLAALRPKLEELNGRTTTAISFVSPSAIALEIGGSKFVLTVERLPCECSSCAEHNE